MFAALAHSRRSHAQSSRHSEVTLLGKIPLGETRAWGKLALGHYLRLAARRSLEREEAWKPRPGCWCCSVALRYSYWSC